MSFCVLFFFTYVHIWLVSVPLIQCLENKLFLISTVQSILKKSTLNIHWKDWCWSCTFNTLATWCKEPTHRKRPWCWEKLKAGGEGDNRGWDGQMSSPTQWTWVWASSGKWYRTGKPGMLQSRGLQRVGHDWATEQQICRWYHLNGHKVKRN